MKKILLLIAVLAIAGTFLFTGCQKNTFMENLARTITESLMI